MGKLERAVHGQQQRGGHVQVVRESARRAAFGSWLVGPDARYLYFWLEEKQEAKL